MSLREENSQKNGCSSRGLGVAAAAIGVGVGAALYYFFSKRAENPSTEGATSHNWGGEPPQTIQELHEELNNSENSYITVSEATTTDTSIIEDSYVQQLADDEESESVDSNDSNDPDSYTDTDAYDIGSSTSSSFSSICSNSSQEIFDSPIVSNTISDVSDSDQLWSSLEMEWVDISHLELPTTSTPARRFLDSLVSSRQAPSRERSWSLEECSICFDVILRNQEVMSLPCTHHFHQACILPWLQEQQTCPNCRKAVD